MTNAEQYEYESDFCEFCLEFHGDIACEPYLAVQGHDVFMVGEDEADGWLRRQLSSLGSR